MTKLSDAELVVLSRASQRKDGAAEFPQTMRAAVAKKIAARLVGLKLMREVLTRRGMPEWRRDEAGRAISLVILRAGREAISVDVDSMESKTEREPSSNRQAARRSRNSDDGELPPTVPLPATSHPSMLAPRAGTKQALVMNMLSSRGGASLDALANATGWLHHTTRAALTGLRRRGYAIERRREAGGASVYRIGAVGASAAA